MSDGEDNVTSTIKIHRRRDESGTYARRNWTSRPICRTVSLAIVRQQEIRDGSFGTRVKLEACVGGVRHYEIRIIAIGREQLKHNADFLERRIFCARHVNEMLYANSTCIGSIKSPGLDTLKANCEKIKIGFLFESCYKFCHERTSLSARDNTYFSIQKYDNWCYTRYNLQYEYNSNGYTFSLIATYARLINVVATPAASSVRNVKNIKLPSFLDRVSTCTRYSQLTMRRW